VLALAALLGAAAVGVGLIYVLVLRPQSELEQARTAGLEAATTRAHELLSYAPDSLDADLARARDGVSGDFAAQFAALQTQVVEPAVRAGLTTEATVVRGSVVSAEPDRVVTLLFLDQRSIRADVPQQVTPSRIEVTVVRAADQWLVADLRNL
jgi:Mce-associated membrane protein